MSDKNGKLNLGTCIGIIVGGCIGSAIFSLSGQTIVYAGPAAIISWIIAAAIQALYGMQVCELAIRYPRSGGVFVFPQKAIGGRKGDFVGFISAWGSIFCNTIAVAFSAISIGNFMVPAFGLDAPVFTIGSFQMTWTILLAVIAVVLCAVFNFRKITTAGTFNSILVCGMTIAMLIFVGLSFFGKRPDGTPSFTAAYFSDFFTTGMGIQGMFRAVPIAAIAYGACVSISFMVEDVKNPEKTVPASLTIGMTVVMILYTLMIVATIGTCGYFMFKTPGLEFIELAPQFGSAMDGLAAYPWITKLIALTALVALTTTILIVLAQNARTVKAVADSGYFPGFLSKENKNGIPLYATIVIAVIAIILSLRPDWTNVLVGLGALFNVVTTVITILSLIISRKKTALPEGQYKAPFGNTASIIIIIVLAVCYLIGSIDRNVVFFTIAAYITAIAIFTIVSKKRAESPSQK